MHVARARTLSLVAALLVVATVLLLAAPAGAHVDAEATGVTPEGATTVRLSFHHGCAGQATTELVVRVPDGATDVAPQPVEGWTATLDGDRLSWSGGSVPDGTPAEFTFTARLAQADGEEVTVPVIQRCGDVEQAWIGPPAASGQPESEDENPAPVIVVPAGGGGQAAEADPATTTTVGRVGTDASITGPDPDTTTTERSVREDAEEGGANAGGTAGLVVFLVTTGIIIGGGVVLYLRNRRR